MVQHTDEIIATNGTESTVVLDNLSNYMVIGWDIDTTGRRLLDEICHISGYTPKSMFSQYIMPHNDIDQVARRRHLLCTITMGRFRALKDIKSNKTLKSKSEISALAEFIEWLEQILKDNGKKMAILVCHEVTKFNTSLLIKSLLAYNLMDKFSELVKGFANCHTFAQTHCQDTMVMFSLRVLSKVLLDKDNIETFKATERAKLAYEIVQHLCVTLEGGNGDGKEVVTGSEVSEETKVKALSTFLTALDFEETTLHSTQELLARQKSLNTVYLRSLSFHSSTADRKKAIGYRNSIAKANIDYMTLQNLWTENKDGFKDIVKEKLSGLSDEEKENIAISIIKHFENPEPIPSPFKGSQKYSGRYRRYSSRDKETRKSSSDKENDPGTLSPTSTDHKIEEVKPQSVITNSQENGTTSLEQIYFSKPKKGKVETKIYSSGCIDHYNYGRDITLFLHAITGCGTTSTFFTEAGRTPKEQNCSEQPGSARSYLDIIRTRVK
ncbi:Ribonuclease H-like domain [Cinara cedri]|uniref:Ribonuclease H-like domain n=1 Tax=Cinara cedri TaxID=506608 RepID=A0A5E4MZM6_9HEMI|nr:Ribonuclease H-like domain [Cinara cedri]